MITRKRQVLFIGGIFVLALALRIAASIAAPDFRGDWNVYSLVARNIVNGCGVSLSTAQDECVAHFGGNGLPGYPFFIAAMWTTFHIMSPMLVLFGQSVVAALAIAYLSFTIMEQAKDARAGALAGLLLSASLPQIYWAKSGMAETLTCAVEILVLAELVIAIYQRKLRPLRLGTLIAIGVFLRLDFIFFLPAVAIAILYIFPWKHALRQGFLIFCIVCAPVGAWTARNYVVSLPSLLPPAKGWMLPDGSVGPLGYLAWIKTWAVTEKERADAAFFWINDYARIRVPQRALEGPTGARASELLQKLRGATGTRISPALDAEFLDLANLRLASMTAWQRTTLFVRQCAGMWSRWFYPYVEMDGDQKFPPQSSKVFSTTAAYQCAVTIAISLMLLLASLNRLSPPAGFFLAMSIVFVITKTLASVPNLFIENRYTVVVLPIMEVAIAFALASVLAHGLYPRRLSPRGRPVT